MARKRGMYIPGRNNWGAGLEFDLALPKLEDTPMPYTTEVDEERARFVDELLWRYGMGRFASGKPGKGL